jgi:hypothetical protein
MLVEQILTMNIKEAEEKIGEHLSGLGIPRIVDGVPTVHHILRSLFTGPQHSVPPAGAPWPQQYYDVIRIEGFFSFVEEQS